MIITGVNAAAYTHIGQAIITTPSSNNWICNYFGGIGNTTGVDVSGGTVTLTGTLDRVRITTVNGTDTFDAGSVNLLLEG
jgi:hypothetical protein